MQRIAGLMLAAPLVAMAGDAPVAWVDLHASAGGCSNNFKYTQALLTISVTRAGLYFICHT